jgi:hypothetical protein
LCEKGFPGKNVAIGFELSLSQDTTVCFDALESVPYNLFQSAILANVGEENSTINNTMKESIVQGVYLTW